MPRGKEGSKEILAAKLRRAVQRSAQTLGSFPTLLPTVDTTVSSVQLGVKSLDTDGWASL